MRIWIAGALCLSACASPYKQRPAETDALLDRYFSCIQREVIQTLPGSQSPYFAVDGALASCDGDLYQIEKAHRRDGFSEEDIRVVRRITADEGRKLAMHAAAVVMKGRQKS